MEYIKNGYLIQQSDRKNIFIEKYIPNVSYHGVHEFVLFPFSSSDRDPQCRYLSKKQMSKKVGDNQFRMLEFISDIDFLHEYLHKMKEMNLPHRVLFFESQYTEEYCNIIPNEKKFLGYEVCEIPFDPWTLLDLFGRKQFQHYHNKLNENGLFSFEKDAIEFMQDYKEQLNMGLVGDGEVDLYICRVYEINSGV